MKYEIQEDLITIIYSQYTCDEEQGIESIRYFVYNAEDETSDETSDEEIFDDYLLARDYAYELHKKTKTADVCEFGVE